MKSKSLEITEHEGALDHEFDEEAVKNLLREIAESDEGLYPERNDPCLCGSKKKYKNCCMRKDQAFFKEPDESSVRIENCTLTCDRIGKNQSEITEKEDCQLTFLHEKNQESPELVSEEDVTFIKQLVEKHPDNPTFWSHLAGTYQAVKNMDMVKKVSEEMFDRFPNYLFARVNMTLILLGEDQVEKAEEAFGKAHTLNQFYPDRSTFHISEFLALNSALIKLEIKKNNILYAQKLFHIFYDVMKRFDSENLPLVKQLESDLSIAKLTQKFRVITNKFKKNKN